MSLAPRVVVVHRRTELEELHARHGTAGQTAFFLRSRGQTMAGVQARQTATEVALDAVSAAIPVDWRRASCERADLSRFLFAPEDVVVVVGQDGLVANVAKYLTGQPVVGINSDPARNPGVLVPHAPERAKALIALAATTAVDRHVEARTMVQAETDDAQRLIALNEVFLGPPSHQTARYTLATADGGVEKQASSGLIVSTGTGATGWGRSVWQEHKSEIVLPAPAERRLAWFVREAWPSPATGTTLTEGEVTGGALVVTIESDVLVAFGDGVESDAVTVRYGQAVRFSVASETLRLVR